ncbi:MAG: 4Fe-4S binding protein [Bacteroidaceae bacterium]|nr:4Fe-4S binding protein [Bacteroidaceae bacterium]
MMNLLLAFVSRFPRPDFESGYQYPEYSYAVPNEILWDTLDVIMLLFLMGIVTWALYKKRTRQPIFWTSIVSIAYFGFFRGGCVCSIGSIQNVAYAFVEDSYRLPIVVLLFFLIPIIFAYLFGRVFCAGVCPFGALQDLVNVKNYRLSRAVSGALSIIPWLYLIFALLYALTRTRFIICQFDPFIGIFRLGGDWGLIIFGAILLLMSIFTGRPFCRFLCPYGALLSIFSSVSIWKIKITQKPCITCELCHNSCPVDTIRAPYQNKVEESHRQGVMRVISYFVILPLLVVAGAVLMYLGSENLSNAHREVRLYHMIMAHEADPDGELTLEAEAFYSQGRTIEELTASYQQVQDDFKVYGTIAGALMGLVVGLKLINLSLKRTRKEYEIAYGNCIACAKCFEYCPQNKILRTK